MKPILHVHDEATLLHCGVCVCVCVCVCVRVCVVCFACAHACVQVFMIAVDRPGYEERRLSSHATLYIHICDDILENPMIESVSVSGGT